MNTESWCQVEGNSNQKWTRSTRRHYEKALQSSVFRQLEEPATDKGRVDWSMAEKPQPEKLAKKKHFQQKCKHLKSLIEQVHTSLITDSQMRLH